MKGEMLISFELTFQELIILIEHYCFCQLEETTTLQGRDQFLSKYGDWLIDRGINAYRMTFDDKRAMAEMITKYHIFYRYKIITDETCD